MSIDYFGYLGIRESFVFKGGKVAIVENFQEVRKWVDECTNKDGFLYPPIQNTFIIDPVTLENREEVPKSERPAFLHRMPPSHSIEIDNDSSIEKQRKGPSSFLIHLLGFLLGYRLQFQDWWIDGRVPIKINSGMGIRKDTVEDFLSHCFCVWNNWGVENKQLITNLLYMFSRSPHYEWDWERFAIDYMVFDGLWKLHCNTRNVKNSPSHKKRMSELCNVYKIPKDDTCIDKIVDLRNGLFHETLWDGGQPGSSGSQEAYLQILFLRNLIKRLIPAVFGYKSSFVKTGWWSLSPSFFDKAG